MNPDFIIILSFYQILLNEIKNLFNKEKRALKDLNPRHLILETSVLPTELRTRDILLYNIKLN